MMWLMHRQQRGQAAVETALTLPLALLALLLTVQIFMAEQGRLVAQVAAFRSTRAGMVSNGDCVRMTHAAIGALLPAFFSFMSPSFSPADPSPGGRLAAAFAAHQTNAYAPALDVGRDGPIVWVDRLSPLAAQLTGLDDESFDDANAQTTQVLTTRLTFWFPLNIPFANWVLYLITRAQWGAGDFNAANPFMLTQGNANWTRGTWAPDADVVAELVARGSLAPPQYVLPIRTSSAMPMMTPARKANFVDVRCPVPLP